MIEQGVLSVKSIDLRRKTRYKKRRKKRDAESGVVNQKYRQGRSYQDFQKYIQNKSHVDVCEMDTVKGNRGKGKVSKLLIAFYFR